MRRPQLSASDSDHSGEVAAADDGAPRRPATARTRPTWPSSSSRSARRRRRRAADAEPDRRRRPATFVVHGRRATVSACPGWARRRWLLTIAFAAPSSAWWALPSPKLCRTGGSPPTSSTPCNAARSVPSTASFAPRHDGRPLRRMRRRDDRPRRPAGQPRRAFAVQRLVVRLRRVDRTARTLRRHRRAAPAIGLHALLARLRRVHPTSAGDLRVVGHPLVGLRRPRPVDRRLRSQRGRPLRRPPDGGDPRAGLVDHRHDRRGWSIAHASGWPRPGSAGGSFSPRSAPIARGR